MSSYPNKVRIKKKCNKVITEEHFLDIMKSVYKNTIEKRRGGVRKRNFRGIIVKAYLILSRDTVDIRTNTFSIAHILI